MEAPVRIVVPLAWESLVSRKMVEEDGDGPVTTLPNGEVFQIRTAGPEGNPVPGVCASSGTYSPVRSQPFDRRTHLDFAQARSTRATQYCPRITLRALSRSQVI